MELADRGLGESCFCLPRAERNRGVSLGEGHPNFCSSFPQQQILPVSDMRSSPLGGALPSKLSLREGCRIYDEFLVNHAGERRLGALSGQTKRRSAAGRGCFPRF